jgi:hypothetical protein
VAEDDSPWGISVRRGLPGIGAALQHLPIRCSAAGGQRSIPLPSPRRRVTWIDVGLFRAQPKQAPNRFAPQQRTIIHGSSLQATERDGHLQGKRCWQWGFPITLAANLYGTTLKGPQVAQLISTILNFFECGLSGSELQVVVKNLAGVSVRVEEHQIKRELVVASMLEELGRPITR